MNLLVALFLILFEAIPEGFADRGWKTLGGILEFIKLAVITIFIFGTLNGYFMYRIDNTNTLFYLLGGYLLLRFAIFDFAYNISRGINLFYIGSTKIFDKFWRWFFNITKLPEPHFFLVIKLIALVFGIIWLLR
jgi:hypothetical protein